MSDERISDAAVHKATGADWDTWFGRLDEAGCQHMAHADIAQHIGSTYGTAGWWCQMVTVQYERARGLRQVNQASAGWQFSKQKSLPLDQDQAFEAVMAMPGWQDLGEGDERDLGFGPVTVRRVDRDLIRLWIHAPQGRSVLEISFLPSGDKTAVRFTHSAIPTQEEMPAWKDRWAEFLADLAQ